tara:strand:+ start:281 stop:1042 length:762 start_codon:yes stop_codon:yes gene_type:complete
MRSRHKYPYKLYNKNYFERGYASEEFPTFLKIQEGFAALSYALGAVPSYHALEKLMGLEPYQSMLFKGNINPNKKNYGSFPEGFKDGEDTLYKEGWTIIDQINLLKKHTKRQPKKVIDIGGGQGLLASVFSHLKTESTKIDPCPTKKYDLLDQSMLTSYPFVNPVFNTLSTYDTVIFCSSIEHLPEGYSFEIINKMSKGSMLIIVNSFDYHPIPLYMDEHITLIDDNFFNRVTSNLGFEVKYRENSHFVGIKK